MRTVREWVAAVGWNNNLSETQRAGIQQVQRAIGSKVWSGAATAALSGWPRIQDEGEKVVIRRPYWLMPGNIGQA